MGEYPYMVHVSQLRVQSRYPISVRGARSPIIINSDNNCSKERRKRNLKHREWNEMEVLPFAFVERIVKWEYIWFYRHLGRCIYSPR